MSAYLITFHTYGSWLHGRAPGSVDRAHNLVGTDFAPASEQRFEAMRRRQKAEEFKLDGARRLAVRHAIEGVALHRAWTLHALHVRTNHVHAVAAAEATPERVMNDFKSWATRRLREAGLAASDARVWSLHGSTRYLNTADSIARACKYVVEGQGVDLD